MRRGTGEEVGQRGKGSEKHRTCVQRKRDIAGRDDLRKKVVEGEECRRSGLVIVAARSS